MIINYMIINKFYGYIYIYIYILMESFIVYVGQ